MARHILCILNAIGVEVFDWIVGVLQLVRQHLKKLVNAWINQQIEQNSIIADQNLTVSLMSDVFVLVYSL